MDNTHLLAARPTNGDDRDRTDDLRLAKAALSQLSYIPWTTRTIRAQVVLSETALIPAPFEWAWVDLNYRPHAYQACALTS